MKKITAAIFLLFISANFTLAHCPAGPDLAAALKEALNLGAKEAIGRLSKKDGFLKDEAVKILLPSEAQSVIARLQSSSAGKKVYKAALQPIVNELVTSLNRSAEDAVTTALPIFGDAVKNITITDAMQLLTGGEKAATQFLREKTFQSLTDVFRPSVNTSLEKKLAFNKSSNDIWKSFTSTYNQLAGNPMNALLGLKPITDTKLDVFVTEKALNGLFLKIGDEEKKIRDKPAAQASDLLKEVFGKFGK